MYIPPLTARTCPVIYAASSDARKHTAAATSSTVPKRASGIWADQSACALSAIARVMSVSINPGATTLTVIVREAKKRRESATAYDEANRPELADRERAELAVLEIYLPQQLSDDELNALIDAAVAAAAADGHEGMRAMGVVMKSLQPQVAGRADGTAVANAVKARLAS